MIFSLFEYYEVNFGYSVDLVNVIFYIFDSFREILLWLINI